MAVNHYSVIPYNTNFIKYDRIYQIWWNFFPFFIQGNISVSQQPTLNHKKESENTLTESHPLIITLSYKSEDTLTESQQNHMHMQVKRQ
jgi:hypothetical protein